MDRDVLDRQLDELCRAAMAEAKKAVELAPDGRWIAASEWEVREVFQKLTRDCYQLMIQAKTDAHAVSSQAAFSPGAGSSAAQAAQRALQQRALQLQATRENHGTGLRIGPQHRARIGGTSADSGQQRGHLN